MANPEDELQEDVQEGKNPLLKNVETKLPSFDKFDKAIANLKDVRAKVQTIKNSVDLGWIRVNSEPLKKNLEATLNEWISVYVSFL